MISDIWYKKLPTYPEVDIKVGMSYGSGVERRLETNLRIQRDGVYYLIPCVENCVIPSHYNEKEKQEAEKQSRYKFDLNLWAVQHLYITSEKDDKYKDQNQESEVNRIKIQLLPHLYGQENN
jgi:hypothetical protein